MNPEIVVRAERAADAAGITDLVRRAYATVAHSDHREHRMVERLRRSAAFVPVLSLVAERDGVLAGHLLLTRAWIRDRDGAVETLALAPLSVAPAHQGRGVGRRLVEAAHARAEALGFGSVVLVGPPGYYRRFGYEPLSRYPITLPFVAPPEQGMILPLRADALAEVAGTVEYARGWLDH